MTPAASDDWLNRPLFFVGIGGSGMLPLARVLKARGVKVAGSDRSFDQGITAEKFAALEAEGFELHPQDGSGIVSAHQLVVASAAIEESVPDVARASELGCKRVTRAELLALLFNSAKPAIGIAGTSGKSTVTGMIGWILFRSGLDPVIINGAVMKNFASETDPLASSVAGGGDILVAEVDESDGSIALFRPAIGVLLNVSLDHMELDPLRELFGGFLAASDTAVINTDDDEARALLPRAERAITFGLADDKTAAPRFTAQAHEDGTDALAQSASIFDRETGGQYELRLAMPGRHNLANALAAIAAASAAGVEPAASVEALATFKGLARRFDLVGYSPKGIAVIDDFGHNPEKCAATLRTLKSRPGRVLAFFQPHGYGPLQQMGAELAEMFARELGGEDHVFLCDPVYRGGTVDRSEGSERIVRLIERAGGRAVYIPEREGIAWRLVELARPGDRIAIMGARDDTLARFAKDLLARLP